MEIEKALKKARRYGAQSLHDVIDDYEIEVKYIELGKSMCGMFYKKGSGICIVINKDLSLAKQEFVLAHEVGHAMMHSDIKHVHCRNYGLYNTDVIEQEANTFAVRFLWDENEYENIEHFCHYHELEIDIVKDMFGGKMGKTSIL